VAVAPIVFRGDRVSLVYLRDITERKKAEQALRANERRLQTLMDAAPVGVSWSDASGNIVYSNRKFTQLFGYTLGDIPTIDDWRRRAYPDRRYREALRPLVPAIIEAQRQGKDVEPMEVMVTCKDGSTRWVAQTGGIASDLVVAIYTDLAERKKVELSLRESEKKFRDLAEKSVVGIYLMQNGVFRYVNSRFAEIHGYEADELIDKKGLRDTVFPDDLAEVLKKDASGEAGISGGFRIVTKQGKARSVEIYGALTMYQGKKAVVGTLLDVTERKATEEALRWKTAFLEALLHTSLDGILVMNDQGKIILENQRSMELLKIPQDVADRGDDEAQARHVLSMVKDPESFHRTILYFLSHPDECVHDEVDLVDGRVLDRYSSPVVGKDGTCYGRIWGFHDITERKRASEARVRLLAELESKNEELEAAYRDLQQSHKKMLQQEKMASIGQLAAGVAHEINNPMGFITSNLNSLRKYMTRIPEFITIQSDALGNGTSREEVAEKRKALKIDYLLEDTQSLIKESLEGADRVKRIVCDLKNFSRVDQMEVAPADINRILDSTLNIVWNELKHKAAVSKDYGEVPLIGCNAGQLSQVFMNILVNGAQAITGFGEITIKTRLSGERVLITISDTGSGIPEEKLDRIFEPFFTTKEIGQGTGLGLSIAYDIVKKHGGEIGVVSEVGKGTTFTVALPLEGEQNG
jgi:two-component system NtrC family sensor kinase